jgi:hypothetical protein
MIAQAMISDGSRQKRSRLERRGAQHAPQPGMVRGHGRTGSGTVVQGNVGARLLKNAA